MVMDNNDAQVRVVVQPAYRRVKGFQPLYMAWGPYIVSVNFRGGKKQGNYGSPFSKKSACLRATHRQVDRFG